MLSRQIGTRASIAPALPLSPYCDKRKTCHRQTVAGYVLKNYSSFIIVSRST